MATIDVVVIGAGAAGMMCAATAASRGRSVGLVDHAFQLGEKIRISGGGRCNFTNIHCRPENFLSGNLDFCRSALARYTPGDFVALVESYGIAYHEKKLGQLFCDESAHSSIEMLRDQCSAHGVKWHMPRRVGAVDKVGDTFVVRTDREELCALSLVIATGGLSVPKLGASALGYHIAERFGLRIVPPRPALVPLTLNPHELARYADLSGVSIDATVSCGRGSFRENLLFTHRGISGPAVLQISSYWAPGETIHIDLLPDHSAADVFFSGAHGQETPAAVLAGMLPRRFAQQWCGAIAAIHPVAQTSDKTLRALAGSLRDWQVKPSGTMGYAKAEVTLGGVDTDELSSRTMEAKRIPGLYFIGEVVDVTGQLGGFNFQWAWASGYAAGQSVAA